jgi:hypothetical protein
MIDYSLDLGALTFDVWLWFVSDSIFVSAENIDQSCQAAAHGW